jgi:hypothetical protein
MQEADVLADTLTPAYETTEKLEELELAYVFREKNNIIKNEVIDKLSHKRNHVI